MAVELTAIAVEVPSTQGGEQEGISLPNGPLTFSAQVVFLLGAAPCSSGTTTLAATPALWVSY